MISQVTFWVEHGEDTDTLEDFVNEVSCQYSLDAHSYDEGVVLESDFIVDVPSPVRKWFVNEEGVVYDCLPEHQAERFPNDFHRAFDTKAEAQKAAHDYMRITALLKPNDW